MTDKKLETLRTYNDYEDMHSTWAYVVEQAIRELMRVYKVLPNEIEMQRKQGQPSEAWIRVKGKSLGYNIKMVIRNVYQGDGSKGTNLQFVAEPYFFNSETDK